MLSDQELQSLRNWGNLAEEAADEICALRAALAAQPAPAAAPSDDIGLPAKYMLAKLQMVMPLFQEARDALPSMTEIQRKLHGVSPTLADRMDVAGTFSLDDWIAAAGDKT